MKIWKHINKDGIFLNHTLADKNSALSFIAESCRRLNIVQNAKELQKGLEDREKTMSTGIGGGIALPHTAVHGLNDPSIILITTKNPINFDSLDKLPVDIIIAIIMPRADTKIHARILAGVSRLCRKPGFLESLRLTNDSEKLLDSIRQLENTMDFH